MIVRQADQYDFHACLDILPKDWRAPAFEARLGHQLWKDYVFVAVDDKDQRKVMGFLACDSDFFDTDGFYLRTTVVGQQYAFDNVAEQLIRKVCRWAFQREARRVFVDIVEPTLGKRLENAGFEKVGEIKHMHNENIVYQIYSLKAGSPI